MENKTVQIQVSGAILRINIGSNCHTNLRFHLKTSLRNMTGCDCRSYSFWNRFDHLPTPASGTKGRKAVSYMLEAQSDPNPDLLPLHSLSRTLGIKLLPRQTENLTSRELMEVNLSSPPTQQTCSWAIREGVHKCLHIALVPGML